MSRWAAGFISRSVTAQYSGGGIPYVVQTTDRTLYVVLSDNNADIVFVKSTDGGTTWSAPTAISGAITVTALSVWYDRWSNISAGLIHVVWADSASDDIFYRSIDTESADALGTQTVVFAGTSTASGGALTVTRARGGNIVVAGSIDAGAEDGAWESNDVGATWGGTIADPSEGATQDQYLLLPGWNADTQDVMLIFWDASANELSVKRYDDSGDSWTETSIATGMTDTAFASHGPHMAAFVDISNSQNVLIAWSAIDTANADLRCWKITDTTITEMTEVVLNSTDDQGFAALALDTTTGYWWAFYAGASDGSETIFTSINIYYKISQDGGTTWGPETKLTSYANSLRQVFTVPIHSGGQPPLCFYENNAAVLEFGYQSLLPRSKYLIGI